MLLKRFARDVTAAVAVEFAFIAPVLVVMYFGLAEMTEALMAQRRVDHAASTVGDLVAQGATTSPSDISDIFTVGETIVAPFPTAPLELRVSSVTADASGNSTVDWSQATGMAPRSAGSSVAIPSTAISANQSIIMSEVSYVYNSPIDYFLPSAMTFTYTYYFHPRVSNQVICSSC